MGKGYLGGGSSLRKLSRSSMRLINQGRRCQAHTSLSIGLFLSGAAPRPNAESMSTLRTTGGRRIRCPCACHEKLLRWRLLSRRRGECLRGRARGGDRKIERERVEG